MERPPKALLVNPKSLLFVEVEVSDGTSMLKWVHCSMVALSSLHALHVKRCSIAKPKVRVMGSRVSLARIINLPSSRDSI